MRINYGAGQPPSYISMNRRGSQSWLHSHLEQSSLVAPQLSQPIYRRNVYQANQSPATYLPAYSPNPTVLTPIVQVPTKDAIKQINSVCNQEARDRMSTSGSVYSETGSSKPFQVLEPLLNPPPLPPPEALIVSAQLQTHPDRQRNHVYPDSSDMGDSKFRQMFLEQYNENPSKMMNSEKFNGKSVNHSSRNKKVSTSTKYQRTASFNSPARNIPSNIPQTIQERTELPYQDLVAYLECKKAFSTCVDQTPRIPTFNYNRSVLY